MPELPEVETIRRDLAGRLSGRRFKTVTIVSSKSAPDGAAFFKKNLEGRKIAGLDRRGKLLIFRLAPATGGKGGTVRVAMDYLLIHLKMTGQLVYADRGSRIAGGHSLSPVGRQATDLDAAIGGALPNRYTRASFSLSGGGQLYFNDLRKFGYLKLVSEGELGHLLKSNYGPEPLSAAFSPGFLTAALKGKKTKVKAALLDQKLIAGLGNIYVDESLFAARLSPLRLAGSLKATEIKRLYAAINTVIKSAIRYRGTTFSDYMDAAGRRGNFSARLKVYGRRGEACPVCSRPILKVKAAGRGTHYCPSCQR